MATDSISVTGVTAIGGVNEITYTIVTDAPPAGGCLYYEGVARVEVWVASTNNRGAATKAGDAHLTAQGVQFKVSGLARNVTRYAWFRAVNVATTIGDWFPTATNGGIAATTSNQVPPDGSVNTPQLGDSAVTEQKIANLAVTNAKIANLAVEKLLAGVINVLIEMNSPIIRTATSGRRIQISREDNLIRVYDGSGSYVCSIGDGSGGLDFGTVLTVDRDGSNTAARFVNSGSGAAVWVVGQHKIGGNGNRAALDVAHLSTNPLGHAILFDSSGGAGVIGVSSSAGGAAFYANDGGFFDASGDGYQPFTGAHPGLMRKGVDAEPGDILVDVKVLERRGISDTVTEVARSSSAGQVGIVGALSSRVPFWSGALPHMPGISRHRRYRYGKAFDLVTINADGEGQINVCGQGGDLEIGDFIVTSDMPGKGMRLDPDTPVTFRTLSSVVARVREPVAFSSPADVKTVACFYGHG